MSIRTRVLSYQVATAIPPHRIAAFADAAGTSIRPANATDRALVGTVGKTGASAGSIGDVERGGISRVELGGAVAAGDPLTSDANARAVKATTSGQRTIGRAEEPGVAGDWIDYMIAPRVFAGTSGGQPLAIVQGVRHQSNARGADIFNATLDTNQSNIDQVCCTKELTSTYHTVRADVFPLYMTENRVSEKLLSPANYSAKVLASTLSVGGIVRNVPCAWGGTSLLNPSSNNAPDAPQWSKGRSLHENLIAEMNFAITLTRNQGFATVPVILDQGGEAENAAVAAGTITQAQMEAAWEEAFLDMRARITGGAAMKIVMIGFLPERLATTPSLQTVENARKAVAARMTDVLFVPGSSGYRLDDGYDVHFNAAGTRVNGRNAGAALAGIVVPPMVTFLNDPTVPEGTGTTTDIVVQVRRSTYAGAAAVPVTLTLGTMTADDFPGGTVPTGLVANFVDGSDATSIKVTVNADTAPEGAETFTLTLNPPSGYIVGAKGSAMVTVTNDDASGTPTYLRASFTAPDGTALTAYTSESGDTFTGGSAYVIRDGAAYSSASGTSMSTCSWVPPSGAYRTRATLPIRSKAESTYIRWRVQDATNFYFAGAYNGATWGFYRMVNNQVVSLGSVTQPEGGIVVGAQYTLEVSHATDGTVVGMVDNVIVFGPVVDKTFATGPVGLRQSGALGASTGAHVTNFETDPI